jgi:hypothetical protein
MKQNKKDMKWLIKTLGNLTQQIDINEEALKSKIYRIMDADKKKRGQLKSDFRCSSFSLRTSTTTVSSSMAISIPSETSKERETLEKKLITSEE